MASASSGALAPGSMIGILGGGQLGRMLAVAAAELGFRVHVYCPDDYAPAFDVAAERSCAAYDDMAALDRFAETIACATIEFENVPVAALNHLSRHVEVRPGPASLEVAQDRLAERRFLDRIGVPVARYEAISAVEDLDHWSFDGGKAVLKTCRLGYDGKGQAIVADHAEASAAFERLGGVASIIEAFVPFAREISAIVARGADGQTTAFEPAENAHRNHILATSRVPARISQATRGQAIATARQIAEALDHVGVLAIEYFVLGEGGDETLVVNEIAPRVHNSGHWSQDGASVSQFEQHVRAVAGWPMEESQMLAPTEMTNLIGEDAASWHKLAAEPGARLHLYGKREMRPGRKMGHVNRVLAERTKTHAD